MPRAAAIRSSGSGSPPSRYRASVMFGVSTAGRSRPLTRAGSRLSAPSAYASSTIGVPGSAADRTRRSTCSVSSTLSRPGPTATTAASATRSVTRSGRLPDTEPSSVSGSPTTSASGTSMLSAAAVDAVTASWSTPAPERSAATPASSTAPGVDRDPPSTRTVPRASLPPPGTGSGHSRSTRGVITHGSDGLGMDLLLPGQLGALAVQMLHRVEGDQGQGPVGAATPGADRAVGDHVAAGDDHQLLLGEPFDEVPEQVDDRLVAEQQHPLVFVVAAQVAEQAAQPQGDVGPRLAAGGPVVELAEPAPPLRLLRQPCAHSVAGQQVEDAQFPIAQPLVAHHRYVAAVERDLRGLHSPQVRRDDRNLGTLVGRQRCKPDGDRRGLVPTGLRERHVGVPLRDVDQLDAVGLRPGRREVARALPVPDDAEPAQFCHALGITPGRTLLDLCPQRVLPAVLLLPVRHGTR